MHPAPPGPADVARCPWAPSAETDALYAAYHDEEWGRPVAADRRLFEKLCLEGFQAGLAWRTVLAKRDRFREAFRDFEPQVVARFGRRDVARLMRDRDIVRHRGKIEAAIRNAGRVLELIGEHGCFAAYVWRWVPPKAERPRQVTWTAVRRLTQTPTSRAFSRDLKRRGFSFVGPTTTYAFMQAVGLVNDHVVTCAFREEVEEERQVFSPPRSP